MLLTYFIKRARCLDIHLTKPMSSEDIFKRNLDLYFIFQKECWGKGGSLVYCFLFQFLTLQGISRVYSTISRLGCLLCDPYLVILAIFTN